jgi:hypothetical protein
MNRVPVIYWQTCPTWNSLREGGSHSRDSVISQLFSFAGSLPSLPHMQAIHQSLLAGGIWVLGFRRKILAKNEWRNLTNPL